MKLLDQLQEHNLSVKRLIQTKHQQLCHHALLFVGIDGIGKRLAAKSFCQGILCENIDDAPCGHCNHCRKVSEDIHPDVLTVMAEGKSETVKITSIRAIQGFLSKTKNEGSCSVVIIYDAETMNAVAQHALLKILEEPQPEVYFVLIANSTELLYETILSRCQLVAFKSLAEATIKKILFQQGFAENECNPLILLAEGSAGRAIQVGKLGIDKTMPTIIALLNEIESRNIVSDIFLGADKENDLVILDLMVMLLRDVASLLVDGNDIRYFPQYQSSLIELASKQSLETIENNMQIISSAQNNYKNSFHSKLTINSMLTDMGIAIT